MDVGEYVEFVGRLKGVPKAELSKRVSEVCARCNVSDMRKRLIGKLSKGYRQRVGLASAIIHNPDVLILDEPTAGLDPEQRKETLRLIRELSGEHTIILSTHILPEVEQTCQKVIIISRGQLVATDTMANLNSRLRGAELVSVEVAPRSAELNLQNVQQKLEQIAGVSRVTFREQRQGRLLFEVESLQGESVRPEIARCIVQADWNLTELYSAGLSLEEIFLQLTATDKAAAGGAN
jgi:ABC-2 type transport system ATP-binding protein